MGTPYLPMRCRVFHGARKDGSPSRSSATPEASGARVTNMTDAPLHDDRALALSFGSEAESYERHRPDFPPEMMDVVARLGHRVLDVGSGTGKAARALLDRGCLGPRGGTRRPHGQHRATQARRGRTGDVRGVGGRGRMFDLVTFARSWHWVEPLAAVAKLSQIVVPGGHVALLTHEASWSLFAHEPVKSVVEQYVRRDDTPRRRPTDARTVGLFTDAGFDVHVEEFPTTTVVAVEEWLDAMFTYSRFLVLDDEKKTAMRRDLAEAIGAGPSPSRAPRARHRPPDALTATLDEHLLSARTADLGAHSGVVSAVEPVVDVQGTPASAASWAQEATIDDPSSRVMDPIPSVPAVPPGTSPAPRPRASTAHHGSIARSRDRRRDPASAEWSPTRQAGSPARSPALPTTAPHGR